MINWIKAYFRGERKVAKRGRAYVPRNSTVATPDIKIGARVYRDSTKKWEDLEISNVRIEKENG